MNNKLEVFLSCLTACCLLLFLLFMPFDLAGFYNDMESYARVHGFDMNKENPGNEYLLRWIYIGIFSLLGLTIITLRFSFRKKTIYRKLNQVFVFVFIAAICLGYYFWISAGFDH